MSKIILLEHNQVIVNAIKRAINKGIRRIFFTEATGLGKSFVFMRVIDELFKDKRVLYITPRDNIKSDIAKYKEFGYIEHCVDMACFADFNTVKDRHFNYDIYFIDEAHHLFSDIQGRNINYVINKRIKESKDVYAFGMTATPYNTDNKMVGKEFFDVTIEGKDLFEAIDSGLLKPIKFAVAIDDVINTYEKNKELRKEKLYAKKANIDIDKFTVTNMMKEYSYVNHWLLYFSRIEELEKNISYFNKCFPDYKVFILHSKVQNVENVINEFEAYEGKAILASVSMILEGVHLKTVEGVLLYRHVHKYNLFFQIVGRLGIMNRDVSPVFIDVCESYRNVKTPIYDANDDGDSNDDNSKEFFDEGGKAKFKPKYTERELCKKFKNYAYVHPRTRDMVNFSIKARKYLEPTYKYLTYVWNNNKELANQLGISLYKFNKYRNQGLSHEEIIQCVLHPELLKLYKGGSYNGVDWLDAYDLAIKLDMEYYIMHHKLCDKNMSYEEIIDEVKGVVKMGQKVVARFEKVSFKEFKDSWIDAELAYTDDAELETIYDNIKLPQRSTKRSSGYDFFYPGVKPAVLTNGNSKVIPTGIRCVFLEDGYDLSIYPRSGMGFKYRVRLDNTVGIVDNDYFESDNEGHIKIKISYDRRSVECVKINTHDKFAQGIFREFFLAEGDAEIKKKKRDGGMGSTGK